MVESDVLTDGQKLAERQVMEIVSASRGSIEVVRLTQPTSKGKPLIMEISWPTGGYDKVKGGIPFRDRELIKIYIPAQFPIEAPSAYFSHYRYIDFPHVLWGNYICLYQAPDAEWVISDGIFGYFSRLKKWLRDAALNELEPDNLPLHPPYSQISGGNRRIVIGIDAPKIPESDSFWRGALKLSTERNEDCFDAVEWVDNLKFISKKHSYAAVLLLKERMPIVYPNKVYNLISTLEKRGVEFSILFEMLKSFAKILGNNDNLYFVLGSPMRRRRVGEPLQQHLAAWSIDSAHVRTLKGVARDKYSPGSWENLKKWALEADVHWCKIYENRPDIIIRRDQATNANWFCQKRVAIFGCGALGSHMAEYVARAGAKEILFIDNSFVNPGLLTRQQFNEINVGRPKASSLACNLHMIDSSIKLQPIFKDLKDGLPGNLNFKDLDFIIDATASRSVAACLQMALERENNLPPILRCAISSHATHGVATLRNSKSQYGPFDLIRQTKLMAARQNDLSDFYESFWPENQHLNFQPEPGCSEPTFIGSAADVAFFASSFFDFAASKMQNSSGILSQSFFVSKARVNNEVSIASHCFDLPEGMHSIESGHGYKVVLSRAAEKSINSEINFSKRMYDPEDETGGLILGEIDESLKLISIDVATGAPPDSKKSPEQFLCGIEGTKNQCECYSEKTGGSTKFIGVWHTHPVSAPKPSITDLQAMKKILHAQEKTPRHVVMLIIGNAKKKPEWRFQLFRKGDFNDILVNDESQNHGVKK